VDEVLKNVCPNCGGGFVPRPIRPKEELVKYPVSQKVTFKPVDKKQFIPVQKKWINVKPEDR